MTVPAAAQTLAILRHLAAQPAPVGAAAIARELGVPRSTTYQLLATLIEQGFVVHLPEQRLYGLGLTSYELGMGYTRQAPLQRLARVPVIALVERLGHTAHLAVLHGREVVYVIEERAPGRPPLVTDVGVRLPAHLAATGRAMLAALSGSQVRALYPGPDAPVQRTPGVGPGSVSALKSLLVQVRRRGFAVEDGEITPGFASVAAAVLDHSGHPVAGLAVTYPVGPVGSAGSVGSVGSAGPPPAVAAQVRATAAEITRRIGG